MGSFFSLKEKPIHSYIVQIVVKKIFERLRILPYCSNSNILLKLRWKKKLSHFDLKSWVTGGPRIPSNWRMFDSIWLSISSKFDSDILQLLSTFKVKMSSFFLSVYAFAIYGIYLFSCTKLTNRRFCDSSVLMLVWYERGKFCVLDYLSMTKPRKVLSNKQAREKNAIKYTFVCPENFVWTIW